MLATLLAILLEMAYLLVALLDSLLDFCDRTCAIFLAWFCASLLSGPIRTLPQIT